MTAAHRRYVAPYSKDKTVDEHGKRRCGFCGVFVKGRRTRWCSTECNYAFLIRWSPGDMRSYVAQRDKGVCALCHVDTNALHGPWQCHPHSRTGQVLGGVWGNISAIRWQHRWEVDHTVPLIEGGSHGPENCRTLCLPCHKIQTAELAARRAIERKAS